jgi:hypothetical protein
MWEFPEHYLIIHFIALRYSLITPAHDVTCTAHAQQQKNDKKVNQPSNHDVSCQIVLSAELVMTNALEQIV